ncbi:MAG: damage-inducible protein CinA, partial [Fusobacteriaceae bacterium]|nr:damage-inducible protein CinA [Fusobacteriaceae bacterium]
MKAGVILVGTELLNGGTVDTNSIYIGEELNRYGIEMEFKMAVRDVEEEILKALAYAKKNVDLVILSGGLGPTIDDITKQCIAKYCGVPLIVDPADVKILEAKFQDIHLPMIPSNIKQIEKPEGAVSFPNGAGMAPGIYIDGIAAFPGIPRELYDLLPKFLAWYEKEKNLGADRIYIRDILTYGLGESLLDNKVKGLFTEEGIYYEFLVKSHGTIIRLQSYQHHKKNVEKIVK